MLDPSSGLMRVSGNGGEPEILTSPAPGQNHVWPEILPDGNAVLFTITGSGETEDFLVAVLDLDTGESRALVPGGTNPRYVSTGHIVYAIQDSLRAVAFDAERHQVLSDPVLVLREVDTKSQGAAQYSLSTVGSLVYVSGGGVQGGTLVWVDRQGNVEPMGAPIRNYGLVPRLSPNEQHVAVQSEGDIWVFDIVRQTLTRLTFEGADMPVWTPNGEYLTYRSQRAAMPINLFWTRADGSGPEERLTTDEHRQTPSSWDPDGQILGFYAVPGTGGGQDRDIWVMPFNGDREPSPFIQTQFNEAALEFSPDGNWVAYVSDETGRDEVYVLPFPGPGGKRQISTEGGGGPVWSRDGQELFYFNGTQLMAVDIETEPGFTAGTPSLLFEIDFLPNIGRLPVYDVTADGQRFVVVQNASVADSEAEPPLINIVLNWFEELKQRVPAGN